MSDLVLMLPILALYLIALGVYYCAAGLHRVAHELKILVIRLNTLLEQRHE